MLLMKAVLPYLPTDRSGRVVNVSSVSASLGFHEDGMYGEFFNELLLATATRFVIEREADRCFCFLQAARKRR